MPPRRSSPRYIGSALIAVNQRGESEIRLSARMNDGLSRSGFSAWSSTSFAFSCVSVSRNLTLMLFGSVNMPSSTIELDLSVFSTVSITAASILAVTLSGEIWTAGTSPKKFGSV